MLISTSMNSNSILCSNQDSLASVKMISMFLDDEGNRNTKILQLIYDNRCSKLNFLTLELAPVELRQ